jgi:hypothetical protein
MHTAGISKYSCFGGSYCPVSIHYACHVQVCVNSRAQPGHGTRAAPVLLRSNQVGGLTVVEVETLACQLHVLGDCGDQRVCMCKQSSYYDTWYSKRVISSYKRYICKYISTNCHSQMNELPYCNVYFLFQHSLSM